MMEDDDMRLMYSSLAYHYIYSPEEFTKDKAINYMERLRFIKPKFIGIGLTEKKYQGISSEI